MKTWLWCILLSFSVQAQELNFGRGPVNLNQYAALPVYYYPFYNGVQIIELDYFTQSVKQGEINDALFPRGGSNAHDAMMFNRPNGYLLRAQNGEIIANYGALISHEMTFDHPDSCTIITHKERMEQPHIVNYHSPFFSFKDQYGYAYRISRLFVPQQRTEMPEMGVELIGLLDTLGNVVLPMNHHSIDYADGEYLVHRDTRTLLVDEVWPIDMYNNLGQYSGELLPYAIYNDQFELTLDGNNGPLRRLKKDCYVRTVNGQVIFMDSHGEKKHPNKYNYVQDARHSDLLIYAEYRDSAMFQGLLSRDLEEITPAIFQSIISMREGFMVRDGKLRNGFLDPKGKTVVPFEREAQTIEVRRDGFISFTNYRDVPNGQMLHEGLMAMDGTVILEPVYWQVDGFQNGLARIQKDNKWGLVNRAGEIVLPIEYQNVGHARRNFIDIHQDMKRGLVDHSGKIVLEPKYAQVFWLDSMIHYADIDGNFTLFNYETGEHFQHFHGKLIPQENGLSFCVKGEKFGLLDQEANYIIPPKFEKIHAYRNNRAVVKYNGKYGLIDEKGNYVKAIKYISFTYDDNGYYLLR